MATQHFDQSSAQCLVFTHKEGLLSAVAHDLKIRVTKFVIDVDEAARTVDARFDAGSLRVVCAMQGDAESPGTLTRDNTREIERNIVRDVLESRTYPEIRFVSSAVQDSADSYVVKGRLSLHGRERAMSVTVDRRGGEYVAEGSVHQPHFGITPYSALLGTLRVGAVVKVRVVIPAPAGS